MSNNWEVDRSMVHFFRETCLDIVNEPKLFPAFRSLAAIRAAVDNVTEAEGYKCWRFLSNTKNPWMKKYAEHFQRLDALGGPKRVPGIGPYSATMARYIFRAADLLFHFQGCLDGCKIAEIGCGYGGLASVIHAVCQPRSYTIYDTPEPLGLAKLFLKRAGVTGCHFLSTIAKPKAPYDLCISDYALNELGESTKQEYAATILRHSPRGALAWADPPGGDPRLAPGPGNSRQWVEQVLLNNHKIVQGCDRSFFQEFNRKTESAWGSYHFYWGIQ